MEFANQILDGHKPINATKQKISKILHKILTNFKEQSARDPTATTSSSNEQTTSSEPIVQAIKRTDFNLNWRRDFEWKVGAAMRNQGNSCFLNTALQCLLHAPAFHDWLRFGDTNHQRSSCGNDDEKCIICIFHQTALNAQENTVITPQEMFGCLVAIPGHNFVMGKQHDAYVYLCGLISAMDTAYLSRAENVALKPTHSPMHHLFNGQLKNKYICAACKKMHRHNETFGDLVLDIEEVNSMKAAIHQHFKRHPVSDYTCKSCKRTEANSTNRSRIIELPLLLRIQLKRFAKTNAVEERIKNSIEPSLQLDLSDYCVTELAETNCCRYRLVAAAIHHIGATADTGHYTAIGCVPSGNGDIEFYMFDDDMVPLHVRTGVIPRYLSENGYFFIYELMKMAEDEQKATAPVPEEVNN